MQGLAKLVAEYRRNHSKSNNQMAHYAGIPLILFSLMIFLGWIHITIPGLVSTHLGWLFSLALVVYYFFFDWMVALAVAAAFIVLNFIAGFISQPAPSLFGLIAFAVCFAGGAAALFVGHNMEGNKPSPIEYAMALVTGPMCIVADLLIQFGYKDDLKKEVEKG